MTIREATKKIERLLYPSIHEINKRDPYFAQEIDEAWLLIRRVALTTCKVENSPSDKGTTSAGLDIPESPTEAKRDDFRANVDESLQELDERIQRLESRYGEVRCDQSDMGVEISTLWDAVQAIRSKLPKEWGK